MNREQAKEKVIRFGQLYGRDALDLASHAAFPLAITPDLLYCMRENFLIESSWLAIGDLLLSPLCGVVGNELYEMNGAVRDVLLRRLVADRRFGEARLHQLADFMGAYIQAQVGDVSKDLGQGLEWVTLTYANPNNIKLLQQKIRERLQAAKGEVRQQLASFLEEQEDLLLAAGLEPLIVETQQRLDEAEKLANFPLEEFVFQTAIVVDEPELPPIETQTVQVATIIVEEAFPSSQIPQRYVEQLGTKRRLLVFEENVELEMILIPAGRFLMGSPENDEQANSSEKPQHLVNVPAFYMGKYPITQAQWNAVATLPRVEIELSEHLSLFNGDDRPVESVSWHEVMEFCARLSRHTGKDYRLPSEAEWEYACRAVTSEESPMTRYYFGDDEGQLGDYAWYSSNSNRKTHSVGQKKPNDFGLYDLHGNVWEWCQDDYHDSYEGAPADGSAWVDQGDNNTTQIIRGGSWYSDPRDCRSASRSTLNPFNLFNFLGFRVVCPLRGR